MPSITLHRSSQWHRPNEVKQQTGSLPVEEAGPRYREMAPAYGDDQRRDLAIRDRPIGVMPLRDECRTMEQ